MAELKACPFCGSEPTFGCAPLDYPNSVMQAYVTCDNCGAEITRVGGTKDKDLLPRVFDAWNRRASHGCTDQH